MATANATTTVEIEFDLSGTITEAYRGDATCPPNDRYVEGDVSIEGVGVVTFQGMPRRFVTTSVLDGVNVKSPDIQKLFANILAQIGEQADDALLTEASEAA